MQVPQMPDFIYRIIQKRTQGKRLDKDVELNDLSYEDALLDAQARSFFQTEYEDIEAPADLFPRLAKAIQLHEQERRVAWDDGGRSVPSLASGWADRASGVARRFAVGLRQALAGLYQTGSRIGTSRVLSGGLVTALLVVAIAPNMLSVLSEPSNLNGRDALLPPQSLRYTLPPDLPDSQTRLLLLEQKTGEDFDGPYQIQDTPPLDPAELILVEKNKPPVQPAQKVYDNGQE